MGEEQQDLKEPAHCRWVTGVDEVLEELHCVGVEFEKALELVVDSLSFIALLHVFLLLSSVCVLEVGSDAMSQVSVNEMAYERLERCSALLFLGQGDLSSALFDRMVAMRVRPLVDSM